MMTNLKYGDWIRYDGKDYQYFETTDAGEIVLRDPLLDWDFTYIDYILLESRWVIWVCKADDERFFIGNHI